MKENEKLSQNEKIPSLQGQIGVFLFRLSLLILNTIKNISNLAGYQELFHIQYEARPLQLSFSKSKAVL